MLSRYDFTRRIEPLYPSLLGHALRRGLRYEDAEDAVGDARFYSLTQLERLKPDVSDEDLARWLFRILGYRIQALRRQYRRETALPDDASESLWTEVAAAVQHHAIDADLRHQLRQRLRYAPISERARRILVAIADGERQATIALRERVSQGRISQLVAEALPILKKYDPFIWLDLPFEATFNALAKVTLYRKPSKGKTCPHSVEEDEEDPC